MASKKTISLLAILVVAAAGAAWGVAAWRHGRIYIATDNAYVRGPITTVASRIPGPLLTVDVTENQAVKAGQVLATLDPRDYDAQAQRAEASLQEAGSSVALDEARVAQARAQVTAALSQQHLAELERARFKALVDRGSIPRQKFDHAQSAAEVASAQVEAARKQVTAAEGLLQVSRSKVAGAQASLEAARLQRSYCTLVAPCDGYVSRKLGEPGMVVAPGQPICAIVPLGQEELWVEANFKETQLKRVRPGQPVRLVADMDEHRGFSGQVESLSAGTGAAFSLLPAENATGNWVKVVQRVPVRIRLAPGADPEHRLRLGMTVSAEIDTRER
nr:HlyD family secretion protein [uncultured Holophaga sp.]